MAQIKNVLILVVMEDALAQKFENSIFTEKELS